MRIRATIDLPNLPRLPSWAEGLTRFLERLRAVLQMRDRKIAEAINTANFEIVDTEPSDAPDYGEPQIRFFKHGTDGWRIYLYTGATDGWVYFNHS